MSACSPGPDSSPSGLRTGVGGTKSKLSLPNIRVAFFAPRPFGEWAFFFVFFIYFLLCVLIYFRYVEPWIAGQIDTRIGADSDRYWEAADLAKTSQAGALITFSGNLLGPVLLANTLHDGFAVMCFNTCLFLLAVRIAWSIPHVNKALVGFLFLLNAELIPALTTLNKEILALLGSVMAAKYFYSQKRSWTKLILILVLSICTRWEQAALIVLYLVLDRSGIRRHSPRVALVVMVGLITVCYPYTYQLLGNLDFLLENATTLTWIDNIQKAFGFPITVGPKIFMLMTGNLHSPQFYNPEYWWTNFQLDVQNILFLPLACLAFTLVSLYAAWTKRMVLSRPIAFFSALTLIITAVPPFTQPRYIYGVYAMLCIDIARPLYVETESVDLASDARTPAQNLLGQGRPGLTDAV